MSINLDELIAQREEATGVSGESVPFEFTARDGEHKGEKLQFSFRDPSTLTDEQQEDLLDVPEFGPDMAAWYMGESEYDRFRAAGGESWMMLQALKKHAEKIQGVDSQGRPTRPNRSSRRARKR